MKKVFTIIFGVLLIGFMIFEMIIMPIMDLTNKKDCKTIEFVYASEILEVEHSINYIIPSGKDYYFVALDTELNAYLVHAPKKWADNNFTDVDLNKIEAAKPIEFTALSKRVRDYEISRELAKRAESLSSFDFPLGKSNCLEITYVRDSIIRFIVGVTIAILAVLGIINIKRVDQLPKIALKAYFVIALIAVFAMVFIII